MEGKTINAIGAAAVVAAGAVLTAPASADPVPAAASYADLLAPVPNAMSRLAADDASRDSAPAQLVEAQYYPNGAVDHHHHHHHHHHSRRWYYQHGYIWNGRMWVLRPVRHHHHHHHHQQY